MEKLLRKIEQWNDADEYSLCIRAIELVPEAERGYQLTLLLGRAYSNLAVLGDCGAHSDDGVVDQELLAHAIAIFEEIRDDGQNDPFWHSRMAYALFMTNDRTADALQYARRWLELEPGNPNAEQLYEEISKFCQGYVSKCF